MLVSPKDTMKRKQFVKGVEQIAQEGAIQIFKIPDSGFEDVVVGVVGTLQFDVFEYRMKNEYGVDLRMSGLPLRAPAPDPRVPMRREGPDALLGLPRARGLQGAQAHRLRRRVERGLSHQAQRGSYPRRLAQRVILPENCKNIKMSAIFALFFACFLSKKRKLSVNKR